MDKGTFIISLDFELLWGLSGWNLDQINAYKAHVEGSIEALKQILEVLDHYDMKCTIAFVGGMNSSSAGEFSKQAPVLQPHYDNSIFSSYTSLIPYIKQSFSEDLLFCQSVISDLSHNPKVELATHTFSHYYCLENGQTLEEFEEDIHAAILNARDKGIRLNTIIFPRNQVSCEYLKICSQYELTHYRGNLETYLYRSEHTPRKYSLRRILRLLDTYINLSGYNTYCHLHTDGNMINVPGSRFLRPYSSNLSLLEPLKVKRVKKSIEYAARHAQIYHLWWHPHNFGVFTDRNIKQLEEICRHYQCMHKRYGLQSRFISEIK